MQQRLPSPWALLPALVCAAVITGGLTAAAQAPDPAEASGIFTVPPPSGEEAKKPEEKKEKEKPFEKVVKDLEKIEGLFTFYRDAEDDKVYVEILPEQFDRDYIYSSKTDQGTGERGLYGTIMMGNGVFQWRRQGKRVQLVEKNLRFRAEPGSPAARALERSFTDSVLASAKRASKPHPDRKSLLVDLNALLLSQDLPGIAQFLKQVYQTGYQLNKKNSGWVMVKSFPKNAELGVVLNYQARESKSSVTLPDSRSLNVRIRYSLVAMPENDYMPRLADDRVGYFMDQHMDFTSDKEDDPYVRFVNRWHLKKKNPDADVSEPVEPIVFWLENSIPEYYRPFFREGVEKWNLAFEQAGFKNAIVVKQQPDDAEWDPADIRYNTIRWFVAYDASFAIGPSHSNPYTGQLIDADIGFTEAILRLGARRRWQFYVDPVQRLRQIAHPDHASEALPWRLGRRDPRYLCSYSEELAAQASFAYDLLAARSDWNTEDEKEFTRQFIVEVTMHEVGHTLGLRHNFRASIINSMDQLADDGRARTVGLAASVMDYNPAIIALAGEPQGEYFPQIPGSYDQWAIRYAYTPIPGAQTPADELPELRKIAQQSADPLHPYATDEDAGLNPRAIDPRNSRFDFAADPLDWFRHEYRLVDELWGNMEREILQPGDTFHLLRRSFNFSWTPYFRGAHVAMKYIGGLYHHRDHKGDPNGRPPFVPVPAAEQRRALEWLAEEIWAPDVFQVQADLLNKLQFQRFWDFEFSIFTAPRIDYPVHDNALFVQSEIFNDLYHPIKLKRLQDLELHFPDGAETFTMADMFVGIRNAVWAELDSGRPINSFRRNLQRAHLGHLLRLVVEPPAGAPEDGVTLARADLVALQEKIDAALANGDLDYLNRAHLEETRARIRQALEAQVERGL